MSDTNIKVTVKCLGPSWAPHERNRYRIYINDELITERVWQWDVNTVVVEDIWANIKPMTLNSIKLDTILNPTTSRKAEFTLTDLMVNNDSFPGEQSEFSFHLR